MRVQPEDTPVKRGEVILFPACRRLPEVRQAAQALWERRERPRATTDMVRRIEARFIAQRRFLGVCERAIAVDLEHFARAVDDELIRMEATAEEQQS